jgi:ComF family protein
VKVLPRLDRLRRTALELLFPSWCLGCGKEGSLICPACRRQLPANIPPICPRCGKPQAGGVVCPTCASHQYSIDGIRSPFRFEGVIRQAIHQLKYRNLRAIAGPLAELLADYLNNHPVPGEVLVPVPLHPRRLRERGYNQSELLAKELSKLVKLPVAADAIVRRQHRPAQARAASLSERRSNVKNAFSCPSCSLENKKAILIDDVTTSGATLDACATALKATTASSVWGLTLATEV